MEKHEVQDMIDLAAAGRLDKHNSPRVAITRHDGIYTATVDGEHHAVTPVVFSSTEEITDTTIAEFFNASGTYTGPRDGVYPLFELEEKR